MSDAAKPRIDAARTSAGGQDAASDATLDHIREALRGMKYGVVSIVVQDGVVVQIEKTEKRRLR